jgi:high-affinity nickel-transport protein
MAKYDAVLYTSYHGPSENRLVVRSRRGGEAGKLRQRIVALYTLLGVFNLAGWLWAVVVFRDHPVLLGTAFLAYTLGLRHAVDADHIAAIDNVTRKLMQDGSRPVMVGFFFSLGHSSVVLLASVGIALGAGVLQDRVAGFREVGGIVGTGVSVLFLFVVATANMFVLRTVYRSFRRVRAGEPAMAHDLDLLGPPGGLLSRLFRPLFAMISKSWHMYPLGFLFGLGFDTATEIALLGISAAEASKGLPIWSILIFPVLFTAGMSLIDATDSVLMVAAYGWAFVKPIRKLYYNLTITFVSVVVALVVGGIEGLGLIADKLGLTGRFWGWIEALNDDFGRLGYLIIAIFVLSWLLSVMVYRLKRFDEVESLDG